MRPIPLTEAAVQLGVTEEVVRQYIRSGALQAFKSEEGQWLVYRMEAISSEDDHEYAQIDPGPSGDAIQTLREHIACLERQIHALRGEIRRRDRIIASQSRIQDRAPGRSPHTAQ